MANLFRIASALSIVTAVLVIAAIVSGRQVDESGQASLPPIVPERVNRIAFVAPEGTVKAITPENSDEWQVSPIEGFYTWPTWSPDARQLVFSGVVRDPINGPRISLYTFDVASRNSREIYVGEPGVATLLANGVVHYPLWSPDSSRIAFIAGTTRGLTLFLDDLANDTDADPVLDNGPLWITWSPDSQRLLVHRGPDHFLIDVSGETQVSNLGIRTGGYRVPAWKPDGTGITLASDEGAGGFTLMEAEINGNEIGIPQPTKGMQESPVFLWSSDGKYLALANATRVLLYQNLNLPVHQDLTLIPADETAEEVEISGNVLSYFWSPDASKLAYVVISERQGVLRWMIYDVDQETSWPLVDFVPSLDQLTMFQFFDQYSYSHSLWSPDSDTLVFAGTLSSDGATASTSQPVSNIITVDVAPNSFPRVLTEGILATWSPR